MSKPEDMCTGDACFAKGCGLGFPRLQSFLRMENYLDYQGSLICARYEATPATVMNGCTCTQPSGLCNELNKTRNFQVNSCCEFFQRKNFAFDIHRKNCESLQQSCSFGFISNGIRK
ncbi:hypothetical protein ANCDUO_01275 [Ancylostoma duodenale]|uniref:Uncharacterized protein n=1 Tax=Ancylostoma duodenale TaxID=51022 RepID=A0A0C2DZE6_9BILA|nr:hypothetical protein ANCDUO_01275 [Ancylostoma duodenale]